MKCYRNYPAVVYFFPKIDKECPKEMLLTVLLLCTEVTIFTTGHGSAYFVVRGKNPKPLVPTLTINSAIYSEISPERKAFCVCCFLA